MIRCHRFVSCQVCGLCAKCCVQHELAPAVQELNGAQRGTIVETAWKAGASVCPMRFGDKGAPQGRKP